MIVELNRAFVPDRLHNRLERHLRETWVRSRISPASFKIKWVSIDPGELVVGVSLENARVVKQPPSAGYDDPEALARMLIVELEEVLVQFLRVHSC